MSHRWVLFVVVFGCATTACQESCSQGYVLSQHVCVPLSPSMSEQDAGNVEPEVTVDSDAGNASVCVDSTFGVRCMVATDCGCDSGFCTGYNGQAGICTHAGCTEDASVCPPNWGCLDLSAQYAGLSICSPP